MIGKTILTKPKRSKGERMHSETKADTDTENEAKQTEKKYPKSNA